MAGFRVPIPLVRRLVTLLAMAAMATALRRRVTPSDRLEPVEADDGTR
jgi:hypothetical protein